MSQEIRLRDYQERSVEMLRANIRRGVRNQILSASTGAGKTIVATYLLRECNEKYRRAVFVADRISLIDQTSAVLDQYGIEHGVIQADHWRWRPYERIQVASAPTLARRRWPDADLIIVDEAHTLSQTVLKRISGRDTITIGLTATPFTRGLGKHYDAVVSVTTTNELIEQKHLVPFRVFSASEPDMTGAKVAAGEWTDKEAAERSMPLVGDCVAEYLKHAEGKKFIAFGTNIAHCEELQRQFLAAGIVCELYVHGVPDEARKEMVGEFRKPDSYIRGLISVSALAKGFDCPDVEAIIMARPLRSSLAEHIQILGRGLRSHPGKTECLVLDHSGNCQRFWPQMAAFFEQGATTLCDGKINSKKKSLDAPEDKKALKCPKCHHVHPAARHCPSCGHIYKRASQVTHEPGELIEVGGTATRDSKQDFYSELMHIQEERGYASGWVANKYREKFGVWPRGLVKISKPPSQTTRNWVRSRQISFAKSKKKEAAQHAV